MKSKCQSEVFCKGKASPYMQASNVDVIGVLFETLLRKKIELRKYYFGECVSLDARARNLTLANCWLGNR